MSSLTPVSIGSLPLDCQLGYKRALLKKGWSKHGTAHTCFTGLVMGHVGSRAAGAHMVYVYRSALRSSRRWESSMRWRPQGRRRWITRLSVGQLPVPVVPLALAWWLQLLAVLHSTQ